MNNAALTFVTFHVNPTEAPRSPSETLDVDKGKPNNRLQRTKDYENMIALMFQSVSVFHQASRKVILTDKNTAFANLSDSIEVYRYDIDANDMMLSRTQAQLAFIKAHDFQSNVVFLDSDILLNDNLETSLEWAEFDIALTVREDPLGMPINGGALFLSNRNPTASIEFLQAFYQRYADKYQEESQWWGDQKALVDLISEDETPIAVGQRRVGESVVQLIPCDRYNYSPNFKTEIDAYGSGLGRSIVHFKGDRKQFMQLFWDSSLHARQLSSEEQFNALQFQLDQLQQSRQRLQRELEEARRALRNSQKQYRSLEKKNLALEARYDNLVQHPFKSAIKAMIKIVKNQT